MTYSIPVEYNIALFRALPTLFPSPAAPPKKLGHASEALLHVLQVSLFILLSVNIEIDTVLIAKETRQCMYARALTLHFDIVFAMNVICTMCIL